MSNLILAAFIMAAFPFVTYLSVKLGTFAYFRGKQLFFDTRRNSNGTS